MVALNWQYINAPTMLNQAMFEGTGGWVLKPNSCRDTTDPPTTRGTLDLSIELFAIQNIYTAGGKVRPYIRCELHVDQQKGKHGRVSVDEIRAKDGEYKVRCTHAKGDDHLDFQRQVLEFRGITGVTQDLSFVR